jgi:hypothetical protein
LAAVYRITYLWSNAASFKARLMFRTSAEALLTARVRAGVGHSANSVRSASSREDALGEQLHLFEPVHPALFAQPDGSPSGGFR